MIRFIGLFLLVVNLLCCIGSSHNYSGPSFIDEPDFKLFGASLTKTESFYKIESYFQSSITGRTEYIFENFNITLPVDIKLNQPLDISQFDIWYAKGGQAGRIETRSVTGYITVTKLNDTECCIDLNCTFTNFNAVGAVENQNTITRTGVLTAKYDYKLY